MSDLISRQVLLLRLADWQLQESPNWGASGMGDAKVYETLKGVEEMIQEVPTIEPKRGRWEDVEEILYEGNTDGTPYTVTAVGYKCSECGTEMGTLWSFCPHCGAKMERSEDV